MYTLGRKLRFSLFGRSHARCVGCILEGVPAGFPIDVGAIGEEMALRRPRPGIGTGRAEADGVEFVEGVVDGRAVGTPIIMEIANGDADGSGYLAFSRTPRPGHADLPALVKYEGFDIAGGDVGNQGFSAVEFLKGGGDSAHVLLFGSWSVFRRPAFLFGNRPSECLFFGVFHGFFLTGFHQARHARRRFGYAVEFGEWDGFADYFLFQIHFPYGLFGALGLIKLGLVGIF